MTDFWSGYFWPTIVTILEVILVAVVIAVSMAYLTYFERKVLALMQRRKGPNVIGPFGLLQPWADAIKLITKETIIPSGANTAIFLIAPMVLFTLSLVAWAVIPFGARHGARQHQCRHPLSLRDLVARRLRHHHGGLGVELEIRLSRRAALGGADGVVRSVDRLRAGDGAALRRIAEPVEDRAGATASLVLHSAVPDVHRVLHFGTGGDQPRAVRSAGRRERAGRRVLRRIFVDVVRAVLSRRIREHDPDERDDQHPVPRRLAAAVRDHAGARALWHDLVRAQDLCSCCLPFSGCARPSRAIATTSSCGSAGKCFCRCRCSGWC